MSTDYTAFFLPPPRLQPVVGNIVRFHGKLGDGTWVERAALVTFAHADGALNLVVFAEEGIGVNDDDDRCEPLMYQHNKIYPESPADPYWAWPSNESKPA